MKTIITLEDSKLPVIEYHNGAIYQKNIVTLDSLIQSIHDAFIDFSDDEEERTTSNKLKVTSGALPMNTVKYGMMENDSEYIILAAPAQKYDVKYHDSKFKDVGFPNLLLVLIINNKKVQKKFAYCYKDKFVRDDTTLYVYPYANVFNGGAMCFYPGNYEVEDLVQLQTWPNLWRTADMNDHLYDPTRTTIGGSLRGLLQSFEGKDFDHSILKKEYTKFSELEKSLNLL